MAIKRVSMHPWQGYGSGAARISLNSTAAPVHAKPVDRHILTAKMNKRYADPRSPIVDEPNTDLIQGTLDMLILKTLSLEPMHGYGIARRIQQVSRGVFKVTPDPS